MSIAINKLTFYENKARLGGKEGLSSVLGTVRLRGGASNYGGYHGRH